VALSRLPRSILSSLGMPNGKPNLKYDTGDDGE